MTDLRPGDAVRLKSSPYDPIGIPGTVLRILDDGRYLYQRDPPPPGTPTPLERADEFERAGHAGVADMIRRNVARVEAEADMLGPQLSAYLDPQNARVVDRSQLLPE